MALWFSPTGMSPVQNQDAITKKEKWLLGGQKQLVSPLKRVHYNQKDKNALKEAVQDYARFSPSSASHWAQQPVLASPGSRLASSSRLYAVAEPVRFPIRLYVPSSFAHHTRTHLKLRTWPRKCLVEERRKKKREKKDPGWTSGGSEKGKIVLPGEWLVTASQRKQDKGPSHLDMESPLPLWGSQSLFHGTHDFALKVFEVTKYLREIGDLLLCKRFQGGKKKLFRKKTGGNVPKISVEPCLYNLSWTEEERMVVLGMMAFSPSLLPQEDVSCTVAKKQVLCSLVKIRKGQA